MLLEQPFIPSHFFLASQLDASSNAASQQGRQTTTSLRNTSYQPTQQTDTQAVVMGALTVLVPLGIVLGVMVHRRLRTTVLRRQIAVLERLWQLNCRKEIQ